MPRTPTVEILYMPLPEAIAAFGPAKGIVGGYKEIAYEIEESLEPILFELYIPKITVATLNATATFFIVDTTVPAKPQIVAEATAEGITAAGSTGPVIVRRRIIPERDFVEEPGKQGRRTFNIEAEASAGTITVPANTAKCIAHVKIDGLGRQ